MKLGKRVKAVGQTLLAVSLLVGVPSELNAEILISPVNNHRYLAQGTSVWPSNLPLATVRNEAENQWIHETFGMIGGTPRPLWIGLSDSAVEGTLNWISGETNAFTNWAPGEPANDDAKDYALIFPPTHVHAGKWGLSSFPGFSGPGLSVLEYPSLPWIAPEEDWRLVPTGPNVTQAADIAVGANGSIYVAGYCGTNTFGGSNVAGFGSRDGYVCRLDPAGNIVWIRNFGGPSRDSATGVAVDADQNVYVLGDFGDEINFGTTNLTAPTETSDLFLSKWAQNGTLLWAIHAASANSVTPQRVAVDASGNVYITGSFSGAANFDSTNIVTAGASDIFVAKYNSAGALQWVRQAGGSGADFAFRLAVSPLGESVITGRFLSPNCTFDTISLTNAGGSDVFIAKYDSEGSVLWARREGGAADDFGNGITLNTAGEIYVTGFYKGTSHFSGVTLTNMDPSAHWDIFLAKYSGEGNLIWAKREGGKQNDLGNDLELDGAENLYLAFTSHGETVIGGATLPNEGTFSRMGLAKYSPEGEVVWANCFGSLFGSDALAVAADESGRAYFAGFWLNLSAAIIGRTEVHGPRLRIQLSGENVMLSWPTNFPGLTLEWKSDLNGSEWTPVETTPNTVVGHFELSRPNGGNAEFYRLREAE